MKKPEYQVCLLLGSNIRPEYNLPLAVAHLRRELAVLRVSSVWESAPVGGNGPNYLNAAILANSLRDAPSLKQRVLRPLETRLGRVRNADKNSPRPIDLDIILFEGKLLDSTFWYHAYRMIPVAEVLPGFLSEDGRLLTDIAARLTKSGSVGLRADVLL
jgi:2-amino-4-hydroxy-6-hydroxymethyldihydropteridine diphosphokinase